jgi:riboflavin transporter FmnP
MKHASITRKIFAVVLGTIAGMSVMEVLNYFLFNTKDWLSHKIILDFIVVLFGCLCSVYLAPKIFPKRQ